MNKLMMTLSAITGFLVIGCTDKKTGDETKVPLNELLEHKRISLQANYTGLDSFSTTDLLARAEKDGLYGYVDTSGKEIVPIKNYNVQDFHDGLGLVEETENGPLYFVDKTGKKVIDLAGYENAFSFQNGYASVAKNNGYGLIDKTGKEVIPCISGSAIFPLSAGNFILDGKDGKTVVNAQGQQTLPFKKFGDLYFDEANNQYAFQDDKGWLVAAPDGNVKFRIDADGLIFNGGAYFLSKTIDTAGTVNAVMNGKGEIVVPYGKYYAINSIMSDGRICVGSKTGETAGAEAGVTNINQKIGYVDIAGKEIIPLQYEDAMMDFSEGLAAVLQNGKFGYIDVSGKMVIPAKYDNAANFQNGFAKVTDLGSEIYIDKKGSEIH